MKKEGKAAMRKNRRNNAKKERTIMIVSSVFVLSALTMTGIYMKSSHIQEQDDGYAIDFTALESSVDDKYQEIAQNNLVDTGEEGLVGSNPEEIGNLEDDLDYLPMEVGSGLVTIPGLTDGTEDSVAEKPEASTGKGSVTKGSGETGATAAPDAGQGQSESSPAATDSADTAVADAASETDGTGGAVGEPAIQPLHFAEGEGLLRPVSGEVLIPFSMDASVYFSTLDQFKYNPAMMIAAETGVAVSACADGRVVSVFENEEIGQAVTMELGDGYRITYGQLDGIRVTEGNLVQPGDTIAFVAAPTKYFSVEGSNLYLKLTADGIPVNPETMLR